MGVDGVNSRLVDFNFSGFWRGLGCKTLDVCVLCAVFGVDFFEKFSYLFQSASFRRPGFNVWLSRHTSGVPGYE